MTRRRIPPPPLRNLQLEYYKALKTIVKRLKILLYRAIEDTPLTGDSAAVYRLVVEKKLEKARSSIEKEVNRAAENMARGAATKLSSANKNYNEKLIGSSFRDSKQVQKIIKSSVDKNVKLIKDIPNKTINKISKLVRQANENGLTQKNLAEKLEKELGISESRAKLIARDQLSKLNSELTRTRQEENGVENFIWRTVGDERVRDDHEAINGEEFSWKSGAPGEGFPGEPVNCRCYAEPVL